MVMESLQRLDPPRPIGKMRLLARLGEGGMASVYLAAVGERSMARLCAVKLLRADVADPDYRNRFVDEANVVVRLHHNNLVDVRECGELDEQFYIAMELVEGRDLADVWDRCAETGRAFPLPLAVYTIREVLRGLHYAHTFPGLGLVHRDVSPSNILVDWAGAVRLADFGLATSTLKATLTIPGLVYGKVGYMAPEQALRVPLDGRADAYACGVVLWELITGRPLRASHVDTGAVVRFAAKRASELSRRIDTSLDAILARALANDRDERYASAHDFMMALSEWLAHHAPDTTQEAMAAFMADLFGDAAENDRKAHAELLHEAAASASAERSMSGPANALHGPSGLNGPNASGSRLPLGVQDTIPSGTVIADRYRIERKIGRGGMGIVYVAQHLTVGRKVAVKVLTHQWSSHPVVSRRFREEARAASAVGHPNIVEVFDAGALEDGRLYLVMEFLTGLSLYQTIEQEGALPVARVVAIAREVARAIAAAHAVGIIHRDLKPDNVMIVERMDAEIVKVLDFGISASTDRASRPERFTSPNARCVGTPEYMAPEQARGLDPTPSIDVYALGGLMYEALTGEPPFSADSKSEILARKIRGPAPPVEELRPDLPGELAELIDACLAMHPKDRPASATEVVERLTAIQLTISATLGPSTLAGTTLEQGLDPMSHALGRRLRSGRALSRSLPAVPPRRRAVAWAAVTLMAVLVAGSWWQVRNGRAAVEIEGDGEGALALEGAQGPTPAPLALDGAGAEAPANASGVSSEHDDDEIELIAIIDEGDDEDTDRATARVAAPALPPTPELLPVNGATQDPSETAGCMQRRDKAKDNFDKGSYQAAIKHLQRKDCWSKAAMRVEYDRMKTRAYFEIQDYELCVAAGKRSRDPLVAEMVRQCRSKGSVN